MVTVLLRRVTYGAYYPVEKQEGVRSYGDYIIPKIMAINQLYRDEEEQDVRVDAEGKDGYMMNREGRDTVRDPI